MDLPTMPEDTFVVFARLRAKYSQGDAMEYHLHTLISATANEPGTLDYVISRDADQPETFRVYEKYEGREAFEKHVAGKAFKDFMAADLLDGQPDLKILKPLEGL